MFFLLFFFVRWLAYYRILPLPSIVSLPESPFEFAPTSPFSPSTKEPSSLPGTNIVHHPTNDVVGEFVFETPVHPVLAPNSFLLWSYLLLISFLLPFAQDAFHTKSLSHLYFS